VFAKLDTSPAGEEQFTAGLRGFSLVRSRTAVATPVPVTVTRAGTLLSEALTERGAAPGQPADARERGDYAAIGRALAGLHQARGERFGLAEFDGFYGPLPQCSRPAGSGRWADFRARQRMLPNVTVY
jgi:fructosamine-3-kinase